MENLKLTCRICGKTGNHKIHIALELYHATREKFPYFECAECGCLQQAEPPGDLSRYYPDGYYSFQPVGGGGAYRRFKDFLEWKRNRYALTGRGLIGLFFQTVLPEFALPKLRQLRVPKTARILDVGCGVGRSLYFLGQEGYQHVTGVDPFIPQEVQYPNGVTIFKKDLQQMDGKWDVVLFNHSLEHMPDNFAAMKKALTLLAPEGWCVVDIPTVSSHAWRHYGIHWSALDAPRHVYLHSLKSFRLLAEQAGFLIRETKWTSNTTQFWVSENFRRGITHMAPRSSWEYFSNRIYRTVSFPLHLWRARSLNRLGQGDCAAFYMQKR